MKPKSSKKNFRESYNSTIFSNIYKKNAWGGKKGEFFSGTGSHNIHIDGYTNLMADFILENKVHSIVEIGCGDFNVSRGILDKLGDTDFTYIGYDVVKPLITRNNTLFGSPQIKFVYKDSSAGTIKSGDLLIIRQVLQHLNNNSIKQIVNKFKNYRYVIFTEHQPSEKYEETIKPNIDQNTGVSIRLRYKSGVYLDKDPFNCNIHSKIYCIPESFYGIEAFINTFLITNDNLL